MVPIFWATLYTASISHLRYLQEKKNKIHSFTNLCILAHFCLKFSCCNIKRLLWCFTHLQNSKSCWQCVKRWLQIVHRWATISVFGCCPSAEHKIHWTSRSPGLNFERCGVASSTSENGDNGFVLWWLALIATLYFKKLMNFVLLWTLNWVNYHDGLS